MLPHRRTAVGSEPELYGIRVNPATRRVIITSNDGAIYIGDMDRMTPASAQWPTF